MPRRRTRTPTRTVSPAVQRGVRALLRNSRAFKQLTPVRQRKLVKDVAAVTAFSELIQSVDFPAFVTGLIAGVFQAIVDSSIRQIEGYADLLAAVTSSVDRFVHNTQTEGDARGYLTEKFPTLFERCADGTIALIGECPKPGAKRRPRAKLNR